MASERPLRLLHLTAGSEPGGVSRYLVDLCTAMTGLGHDVAVAGARGPAQAMFDEAGIRWVNLPAGGLLAFAKSISILRRHLNASPVDVIHAHYRKSTLLARRFQVHRAPPVLYTLHLSDMPMGWRRIVSDFGDRTHAPSAGARRWLVDVAGVAPERVSVVPHGVNAAAFPVAAPMQRAVARQDLNLPDNAVVAAYVGRFDVPKNESWLLDWAAATRASLPHLKLLLQGEGPHTEAVRQRIAGESLADRVTLLPPGDPRPAYTAAHFMLLPSEREGFSLSCAEAMATGTPVLRTRTAGTEELIVEDVTGRSCPIEHDAFLAAATALAQDRDAPARLGAAAAAHVREHFTQQRQVADTIALYRQVMDER